MAQVWHQLGDRNDPNLAPNRRETLNEYGDVSTNPAAVNARVAAEYAREASTSAANHQEALSKGVKLDKNENLTTTPLTPKDQSTRRSSRSSPPR